MAFVLDQTKSIRRGLKQIARKELRHASEHLRSKKDTAVHEAHKSVKKVRAIVKLLQSDAASVDKDDKRLGAVGENLSLLRDTVAVIATFDALRKRFPKRLPEKTHATMRRQLVRAQARIMKVARADRSLAYVTHTLRALRRSVKRWHVRAIDVEEVPGLLEDSYRASRKAMRRAREEKCPIALHRWRKRVKTFWYQLRVAESLAPGLRREIRRFKQLERWLGEDHDLSVLQTALSDDKGRHPPAGLRELGAISDDLQTGLRRKSFALGERLLAEKPTVFVRRLRRAFSNLEP
jgi:hypothetical protein